MRISLFLVIVMLFNSCTNDNGKCHCQDYWIDNIFKNQKFYDTINPQYPITVSLATTCYKYNNKNYKELFIKDSLYNNDTIQLQFIRGDKNIIFAYDNNLKNEFSYLNMTYKTMPAYSSDFSQLSLNSIIYQEQDTVYKYSWIGSIGKSKYFFEISKKKGLININRTYDGPFFDL